MIVAFCFAAPAANADPKLKHCDSVAAREVTVAYDFIVQHLNAIVDPMKYLTPPQRSEVKQKFGDKVLKCRDDARTCVNNATRLGQAHGGIGNAVNLCYYNHVDLDKDVCSLVGTIVHEAGHADGLPHMKGHNNPTPAIRANDFMYRMQADATAFCKSTFKNNHSLIGNSSRPMGNACKKNDQCATGNCEAGECVCKRNSDCTGSAKCRKGFLGLAVNQCVP
jgi:hypothetical protein